MRQRAASTESRTEIDLPSYTHRARKDLEDLPASMRAKVRSLGHQLDQEPAIGYKLAGKLAGHRSINVGRSHRLIYSIEDSGVLIKVIRGRRDTFR